MHALADAILRRDFDAVEALLADDVVFTSPVAFKPYNGKPVAAAILRAVSTVFEDFGYVREIVSADGRDAVLEFEATVNGKKINGADFLRVNDVGKVEDFKVMVRPLSAAQALAERMKVAFAAAMGQSASG
ncbi:MAG: nuclear transport factor 2 family protein [Actinomycetota bacterium]|nr:nuclear transport factor 2 family protein [Actinomycetota bacterium]